MEPLPQPVGRPEKIGKTLAHIFSVFIYLSIVALMLTQFA